MAIAHINIEDAPHGEINLQICYKEGFDVKSNAHQHAYQIMQWMDKNLKRAEEATCEVSPAIRQPNLADEGVVLHG